MAAKRHQETQNRKHPMRKSVRSRFVSFRDFLWQFFSRERPTNRLYSLRSLCVLLFIIEIGNVNSEGWLSAKGGQPEMRML